MKKSGIFTQKRNNLEWLAHSFQSEHTIGRSGICVCQFSKQLFNHCGLVKSFSCNLCHTAPEPLKFFKTKSNRKTLPLTIWWCSLNPFDTHNCFRPTTTHCSARKTFYLQKVSNASNIFWNRIYIYWYQMLRKTWFVLLVSLRIFMFVCCSFLCLMHFQINENYSTILLSNNSKSCHWD